MIHFHLSITALSLYVLPAYGTAIRYALFSDTNCTQEIHTDLVYRPIVEAKNDSTHVLGNVGECYVYEEPSVSPAVSNRITCDTSIGTPVYSIFSTDTCCSSTTFTSASELSSCSFTGQITYSSRCFDRAPHDVASIANSSAHECDDNDYNGPQNISSEAVVNYVAIEYYDPNCTDSTGENGVISSVLVDEVAMATFDPMKGGYYDFSVLLTFGITGTGAYCRGASECRADGTLVSQYNTINNNTCSDEVGMETFLSNEFIAFAYESQCSQLKVDGLYYRPIACTTEAATVGADATYSPTPAPEDDRNVGIIPDDDAGIIPGRSVIVLGMASTTCAFVALAVGAVW